MPNNVGNRPVGPNGEVPSRSTDLADSYAYVYFSDGPFMTDFNPDRMFDIIDTNETNNVIAMEIHSSIDSLYRYGYIVIQDRTGFRETLNLTGNELITLKYANGPFVATEPAKVIHFNIYDMEEVYISENYRDKYTNRAIKIHVMEAPMFLLYNWNYHCRGFGKDIGDGNNEVVRIDEMFRIHLEEDLQITQNGVVELDLRRMSTEMYWTIPLWKPQMTFMYLLDYAKDDQGYPDVKFFPTTNIQDSKTVINLKSIYQMFSDDSNTFQYNLVNVGPITNSATETGQRAIKSLNQIINYKFETYDLTSLISGLAGSSVYNRRYIEGRSFLQTEDYRTARKKQKYMGNVGIWSDNIAQWDTMWYPIGNMPPEIAAAYLENQISKQRYQLKCIADSYMNHSRNCGDRVTMLFPSTASGVDSSKTIDEQMSGEWIIQEMVDKIIAGKGSSEIIFIKDSFFNVEGTSSGNGGTQKLPSVEKISTQNNLPSLIRQRNQGA